MRKVGAWVVMYKFNINVTPFYVVPQGIMFTIVSLGLDCPVSAISSVMSMVMQHFFSLVMVECSSSNRTH